MKKICFVITQGEWGGAQRYVADLLGGLVDDWDITLAIGSQTNETLLELLRAYPIHTHRFRYLVRPIHPIYDLLAIYELTEFFKKNKFDVVHLNSSKAGAVSSLAAHLARVPRVVYTVHGWVFLEPLSLFSQTIYRWIESMTARWKTNIIVTNHYEYQIAQRDLHIPEKKLRLISHGIQAGIYLSKQEARKFFMSDTANQTDRIWFGTVANLYPNKNLETLLAAYKLLKEQGHTFCAYIIGEGEERKKLESLISQYELSNCVYLFGYLPSASRYLHAFDIFVLPSLKEGFPYVLLESMDAQVPIVATRVGGIPEIVEEGKYAILVPPKEMSALQTALLTLMKDATSRTELANGAKNRFQKVYTLGQMIQKTNEVYRSIHC